MGLLLLTLYMKLRIKHCNLRSFIFRCGRNQVSCSGHAGSSEGIEISLSFQSESWSSDHVDWWLVVLTPDNAVLAYDIYQGLFSAADGGISPLFQSKIFDFDYITLPTLSGFEKGKYTFFFGIDNNSNGIIDTERLYFDMAEVVIK